MSRKLQIKTNTEQIEIVDEHGNSRGMIEIAKSDINLIGRLEKLGDKVGHIIEQVQTPEDMTDDELFDTIEKLDAELRNEVDAAFGYPVSETVFGAQHCLSTCDGEFFIVRFINTIAPVIYEMFNAEYDENKLKKYVPQDHKKKGTK